MSHNDIPRDPSANLTRLQGIGDHFEKKLARKVELRDKKLATMLSIEEKLSEFPPKDEMDDATLEEAAQKEQIHFSFKKEVEELEDEISQLKGKISWNLNRQRLVRAALESPDELPLTASLAERLASK